VSKHQKYVPKHRHVAEPTLRPHLGRAPKKALQTGLVMTSVAAAVTGISVAGGTLSAPAELSSSAHDLGSDVSGTVGNGLEKSSGSSAGKTTESTGSTGGAALERRAVVSRDSDRERDADPSKVSALSADSGPARTRSVDVTDGDPRDIARALMPQFGFSADQFGCLDSLWIRESNWSTSAHNASSGAHGIPQSLPGSKMASAGPDWETNPVTQITWGLGYIQDRYGSPCGAWAHSESHGWY
jgi:hypothetical protein